jgi:tRNA 2-thiouridine synthesizing protein A
VNVRAQSLLNQWFSKLGISSDRINSGKNSMADQTLDAKGLNCPLPILKAKKALMQLPVDGTLEVIATDPGSVVDFEAFCRTTGHELVESSTEGKLFMFVIRRTS